MRAWLIIKPLNFSHSLFENKIKEKGIFYLVIINFIIHTWIMEPCTLLYSSRFRIEFVTMYQEVTKNNSLSYNWKVKKDILKLDGN